MKHRDRKLEEFVLKHMGLFKASKDEMERAEARLRERMRSGSTEMTDSSWEEPATNRPKRAATRFALAFGVVAGALILGIFLRMPQANDVHAIVLSVDGSFSRIDASTVQDLRKGERIEAGQRLRTNDATGSIGLADGSRVEMRAGSELSVERADDGVRLHLFKGSLIIKAAKQVAGHLYVQTKDVTVSVVGTVFLVNAEEEGSRVAVIEGEVRVQQGTATKNLLPGQQLATNPTMIPLAVKEQASWTQSPEIQTAILQQPAAAAAQKAVETRATFEVISIRPSGPRGAGSRGARPGGPTPALPAGANEVLARLNGCAGPSVELNPGRIVLNGATVYRLVALGYGSGSCSLAIQLGLLDGGPEWSRTDRYDIQATIPKGSPAYTKEQLTDGVAPKLQEMIRNLLVDRFNLVVRRGTKNMQTFDLVIAKPGKLKLSEDQNPPDAPVPGRGFVPNALPRGIMLNCSGNAITISRLAGCLQNMAGGMIVDKTDLEGLYDIPMVPQVDPSVAPSSAYRLSEILEQTGLKLESTRASYEVLTIERVDRPSEN